MKQKIKPKQGVNPETINLKCRYDVYLLKRLKYWPKLWFAVTSMLQ